MQKGFFCKERLRTPGFRVSLKTELCYARVRLSSREGFQPHVEGVMILQVHMSYSLNSLKGVYMGNYIGDYYRGY